MSIVSVEDRDNHGVSMWRFGQGRLRDGERALIDVAMVLEQCRTNALYGEYETFEDAAVGYFKMRHSWAYDLAAVARVFVLSGKREPDELASIPMRRLVALAPAAKEAPGRIETFLEVAALPREADFEEELGDIERSMGIHKNRKKVTDGARIVAARKLGFTVDRKSAIFGEIKNLPGDAVVAYLPKEARK